MVHKTEMEGLPWRLQAKFSCLKTQLSSSDNCPIRLWPYAVCPSFVGATLTDWTCLIWLCQQVNNSDSLFNSAIHSKRSDIEEKELCNRLKSGRCKQILFFLLIISVQEYFHNSMINWKEVKKNQTNIWSGEWGWYRWGTSILPSHENSLYME